MRLRSMHDEPVLHWLCSLQASPMSVSCVQMPDFGSQVSPVAQLLLMRQSGSVQPPVEGLQPPVVQPLMRQSPLIVQMPLAIQHS